MTLSSSLNAGVAGLNANSSKLGTISDNIANSQTAGYKRADTDFSSLVVSELGGGRYAAGGVRSTSFRQVDASGGLITTQSATDIAAGDGGLIPVTTTAALINEGGDYPVQFVTTGSFLPDEDGFLVTTSGHALLGWPADLDGSIPAFPRDTVDALQPIRINTGSLIAVPTTEVTLGANLPAEETRAGADGTALPLSVEYFDNLGASQSLDITFTPTVPATGASNEWAVSINDLQTDAASNPIATFTVTFDNSPATGGSIASVTGATGGTYDAGAGVFTFSTGGGSIDMLIGAPGGGSDLTQFAADFGPTGVTKNGSAASALSTVSIDENGYVQGVYEDGSIRTLYQVPLADFTNVNGLQAVDGQAFIASPESGTMFFWNAGEGPTGGIESYALEGSSADIAAELTSLITTQRAYSSNATVIRTVDEMLQETTNIKR